MWVCLKIWYPQKPIVCQHVSSIALDTYTHVFKSCAYRFPPEEGHIWGVWGESYDIYNLNMICVYIYIYIYYDMWYDMMILYIYMYYDMWYDMWCDMIPYDMIIYIYNIWLWHDMICMYVYIYNMMCDMIWYVCMYVSIYIYTVYVFVEMEVPQVTIGYNTNSPRKRVACLTY